MSIHLPKKKIELSNETSSSSEKIEIAKVEIKDEMKSGDTARVYKDKQHRVKKELNFQTPKSKGKIA
ncbi:MAG: hypothetical protein ACR2MM_08170 [Flavobacteriaceae bacterium]